MLSSYDSTEICILLRDPIWIFAFWNFNKKEHKKLLRTHGFVSFFLRVLIFEDENNSVCSDYFDIDVKPEDRSRYIHLSFQITTTKVELKCRYKNGKEIFLTSSAF